METYYVIGEWLIEERDKTCWIYKNDVCFARIPVKRYKTKEELKSMLENFLMVLGVYYE